MAIVTLTSTEITNKEIIIDKPDSTAVCLNCVQLTCSLTVRAKHILVTGSLSSTEDITLLCSGVFIHVGQLHSNKNIDIKGHDVVIGFGSSAISAAHKIGFSLFKNLDTGRIETKQRPCLEEVPRFIQALDLAAISAPSEARDKQREYLRLAY